MPVEFRFLDRGIGFLFVGKGLVTGQELIDALAEIYRSEENAKKIKYSIVDYTRIESMDVSNSESRIIAEKHKNAVKITPDRVVAMAASKALFFGLCRVWRANIGEDHWERTTVRSMDEAESWVKEKVKNMFAIDITIA